MVNIKLYKSQVTRYTYIVENEKGVLVSIISIIKKKGGGGPWEYEVETDDKAIIMAEDKIVQTIAHYILHNG
jgi:hypothetical protein